jgi:serine/threonine-protein kinase
MKLLDAGRAKDPRAAAEARARFLTEARIAGQLDHPGVVPIHDLGVDEDGRVFFTMPFFEGRTLEEGFDLIRTGVEGWTLERALLVLAEVCDVVAHAHARDVIHRDLKPANVIVAEHGATYVVDWGLAKALDPRAPAPAVDAENAKEDDAQDGRTLDGTVAGTPPYMAPEQAEGRVADVSFRADVYAIGAMLYRLLAGRAPYHPRHERAEPESPERIVELIRRGAPTPVRLLVPDAPEELVAICERAMARLPVHRHASAEDVGRDLRAFLARPGNALAPAHEARRRA